MMKLSVKSLAVRVMILAGVAVGVATWLYPGFRAVRHEHQVKILLLEIQQALQGWHVDEEIYPRQSPLTGGELIALLSESGHLEEPPFNPWTGLPYAPEGETMATDRIRYSTGDLAETYALKALNREDDTVFLQIDSTEHLSLE